MHILQSSSLDWWRYPPGPESGTAVRPEAESARAPLGAAFWALLAFTVILIGAPQEYVPALAPLRIALVAAAAAAAAHLATRLGARAEPRPVAPEVLLAGCLLIWAVGTIPASMWPGGSVQVLTELYLKSLIVFWLLGEIVSNTRRLRILLWTLSALIVPLSLAALGNFRSGAMTSGRIEGYGGGLTSNPNDLALMLNLLLPLAGVLALTARRRAARGLAAGLAALGAASIVVTFSRAGFLTMVCAAMLFAPVVVKRRGWAPVAVVAALLVSAMPVLPLGYLERVQTMFEVEADPTGSSQERWRDTLAAIDHVRSHPIVGAGLGMDVLALNEIRGKYWVHVHDAYLNYAVDLGLPGLLLFVALLGTSIRSAWRTERRTRTDGELTAFAAGIRIGLCAYALAALFHPTAYHFYFYYLAGLAVAVRRIGASSPLPPTAAAGSGVRS